MVRGNNDKLHNALFQEIGMEIDDVNLSFGTTLDILGITSYEMHLGVPSVAHKISSSSEQII